MPGARFDAAADVDAVDTEFDGFGDVFRVDAAGEENSFTDVADDVPVEDKPRAAVFFRVEGVEQNCVGMNISASLMSLSILREWPSWF